MASTFVGQFFVCAVLRELWNFKCYSTAEANEFIRKSIQNVRKIAENPSIFNGLHANSSCITCADSSCIENDNLSQQEWWEDLMKHC